MIFVEKFQGLNTTQYYENNLNLGTSNIANTTIEILKTHDINIDSNGTPILVLKEYPIENLQRNGQ